MGNLLGRVDFGEERTDHKKTINAVLWETASILSEKTQYSLTIFFMLSRGVYMAPTTSKMELFAVIVTS